MTLTAQDQLVADLARDLIAEMAPEELPLFATISAAYFSDPNHVYPSQAKAPHLRDFGVGDVAQIFTQSILPIATVVVSFLGGIVMEALRSNGTQMVDEWLRKQFKRNRTPNDTASAPPPLNAAQLAQLRRIVQEKAKQLQLPAQQAELLTDAIIGRLASDQSQ